MAVHRAVLPLDRNPPFQAALALKVATVEADATAARDDAARLKAEVAALKLAGDRSDRRVEVLEQEKNQSAKDLALAEERGDGLEAAARDLRAQLRDARREGGDAASQRDALRAEADWHEGRAKAKEAEATQAKLDVDEALRLARAAAADEKDRADRLDREAQALREAAERTRDQHEGRLRQLGDEATDVRARLLAAEATATDAQQRLRTEEARSRSLSEAATRGNKVAVTPSGQLATVTFRFASTLDPEREVRDKCYF